MIMIDIGDRIDDAYNKLKNEIGTDFKKNKG
jgi:hypothetical protein